MNSNNNKKKRKEKKKKKSCHPPKRKRNCNMLHLSPRVIGRMEDFETSLKPFRSRTVQTQASLEIFKPRKIQKPISFLLLLLSITLSVAHHSNIIEKFWWHRGGRTLTFPNFSSLLICCLSSYDHLVIFSG
jgi:hypothetical protein